MIEILPVEGLPEITETSDLGKLLADALRDVARDGDIIVVTQKVVSKAEGRFAEASDKQEALVAEAARVLRKTGGTYIAETRHGFVCANAGIDASNVPGDRIVLLPLDPDLSARRLRSQIAHHLGITVAVIVSDTFGRAWRIGQTDVAIGVAGMLPFTEYAGMPDTEGREMHATRICVADEVAGAAELVMGKTLGVCAAIVRGVQREAGRGSATQIVRPVDEDLFR